VYDFSSELTTEKRVSDAVFQEAIERLGREGVVDLTAVLGYYSFVSMTLCVFEVPAIYPDQIEMA
jgi:4-carboxymuconolactone decarboxylase